MKKIALYVSTLFVLVTACKSSKVNSSAPVQANTCYWQQHVDYKMDIDMNVDDYTYKGKQTLVYTNNSPDVLNKVFYHLFFNAFQPGSEMDVHSLTISDPDPRVKDRISKLKPSEIGFINVTSLKQNGVALSYDTVGTVLEVTLDKPIQPGETVTFDMVFDAQVPLQIRRSGRDNKENVALSMSQWYPKMAEYDFEGWHADPYIGREFYGVWGNFDVTITLDKNYVVGGTGYLQNPNQVGHGYETGKITPPKGHTLTWHFKAPNVHDFTWAADPDFTHDTLQVHNGPLLHFFYKKTMDATYLENWKTFQQKTADLMQFYSTEIGKYPYKQYSVIQAGDGGMEYGMCTFITGHRKFGSLVGVTAHEMAHSWFQFLLATNESKNEWMDEGFTSYISDKAMNVIMNLNKENPYAGAYNSYVYLTTTGFEQPQTTHADRYARNMAYGIAAYSKGEVFLAQLAYVIGEDNLNKTLKKYFDDWAFKHPTPNDFIRCAEKVSGLELDWYLTDWTKTINTIDYGIKSVQENNAITTVELERIGLMPMPLDVEVEYTDGTKEHYYIPLQMMRGEKPLESSVKVLNDWAWAYPTYTFSLNKAKSQIKTIMIDPKERMADVNRDNNAR